MFTRSEKTCFSIVVRCKVSVEKERISMEYRLPQLLTFGKILFSFITLKCFSIGTPNTTTFPFVPNGKWWLLGVPIFEHIIIRL